MSCFWNLPLKLMFFICSSTKAYRVQNQKKKKNKETNLNIVSHRISVKSSKLSHIYSRLLVSGNMASTRRRSRSSSLLESSEELLSKASATVRMSSKSYLKNGE